MPYTGSEEVAMKIEDLYIELGKSMTDKIQAAKSGKDTEAVIQAQINTLTVEIHSVRERSRIRQDRLQQHIDELQEAIRLVAEGTDPTLAKLTAKESLEDRRAADKLAEKAIYNNTGITGNHITSATWNNLTNVAPQPYYPTTISTNKNIGYSGSM